MLVNTFCHLPGIGVRTEQAIWEAGIRCWDDCLEADMRTILGNRCRMTDEHLCESQEALRSLDAPYFARRLPAAGHWRLFPEFSSRIAYLDIETTGLGRGYDDHITTAVLYDGVKIRHYVHGENLRDLQDDLFDFDVLVTYNGRTFDIPFIENYFMISLPHAQIDLRYVFASLGMKGGLKGIERQLGLDRGDLEGVDGYFAVLLWREYSTLGRSSALETLLSYNVEDTVNLQRLLVEAYNLQILETPFEISHARALPERVTSNPFSADRLLIEDLRARYFASKLERSGVGLVI